MRTKIFVPSFSFSLDLHSFIPLPFPSHQPLSTTTLSNPSAHFSTPQNALTPKSASPSYSSFADKVLCHFHHHHHRTQLFQVPSDSRYHHHLFSSVCNFQIRILSSSVFRIPFSSQSTPLVFVSFFFFFFLHDYYSPHLKSNPNPNPNPPSSSKSS